MQSHTRLAAVLVMSGSDAFMSLPEAHLMQFTAFGDTLPDFPSRVEAAGIGHARDFILHWSIPLDKLFQAEVRLTPSRLSGVYFQASEPEVRLCLSTATGYNIKLCSGRTSKRPQEHHMRCWAVEGQTPGALASPLTS